MEPFINDGKIPVTVKTDEGRKEQRIVPDDIHFINIALGGCTIEFMDGRRLYVYQEFEEVRSRIRYMKMQQEAIQQKTKGNAAT